MNPFIRLTNFYSSDEPHYSYIKQDSVTGFGKAFDEPYTWIEYIGCEQSLPVQETPEQILEMLGAGVIKKDADS